MLKIFFLSRALIKANLIYVNGKFSKNQTLSDYDTVSFVRTTKFRYRIKWGKKRR